MLGECITEHTLGSFDHTVENPVYWAALVTQELLYLTSYLNSILQSIHTDEPNSRLHFNLNTDSAETVNLCFNISVSFLQGLYNNPHF